MKLSKLQGSTDKRLNEIRETCETKQEQTEITKKEILELKNTRNEATNATENFRSRLKQKKKICDHTGW